MMHGFEIISLLIFIIMSLLNGFEKIYLFIIGYLLIISIYTILAFNPLYDITIMCYDNNMSLPKSVSKLPKYMIENYVSDKAINKLYSDKIKE